MSRPIDFTFEKNNFPALSKNSTQSTFILFEARAAYEQVTLRYIKDSSVYNIPFGNLYKNNALYGFIDNEGDVILPINVDRNFKSFGTFNNQEQKIQDFVADAFFDMKTVLNDGLLSQKIRLSTPYKDLKIYKSYEDFNNIFYLHHEYLSREFKLNLQQNGVLNSKVKDHKTFVHEYINFLTNKVKILPITKSHTVICFNFFSFPSGLVFDVAFDSADNDEIKFKNYFTDQGFSLFTEACLRHGFSIDENVPWRLYANLNSPATKVYLDDYGIDSLDLLFATRYKKVYLEDLLELKTVFFKAYNFFIENNNIYEQSHKELCSSNVKYFSRPAVTFQQFINDFPNQFWLRLYTFFRNYETNKNLTQTQFNNIVREAGELLKINRVESAARYINNYFKHYSFISGFSNNQQQNVSIDSASNETENNIIF
jgi:hypothetical protein